MMGEEFNRVNKQSVELLNRSVEHATAVEGTVVDATMVKKEPPQTANSLRGLGLGWMGVVLEGFEPPQAEPESDVLPLHHKTKCGKELQGYRPPTTLGDVALDIVAVNGCKVTNYF